MFRKFGNSFFRIQHAQIRLDDISEHFYQKMHSHVAFCVISSSLYNHSLSTLVPLHPLVEYLFALVPHSATVIHGMTIVQKVNGNKKTLRTISNAVLAIALAEAEGSVRIDIVFHVYKDVSIKKAKQQSRSNSVEAIIYKTLFPSQVVQQWDSFKTSPVNKASLIRFIASE